MSGISIKTGVRKPIILLPFLLVCVVVIGYVWFISHFERKPFEVVQGMSPAAYKNQFLAVERYLQQSGKLAESSRGLDLLGSLPSEQDAIILNVLPVGLSQKLSNNLYNWVQSGGHLLLVPNVQENTNPNRTDLSQRIGFSFMKDKEGSDKENSDCGCPPEENEEESVVEKSVETGDSDSEAIESSARSTKVVSLGDDDHPFQRLMRISLKEHQVEVKQTAHRLLEDVGKTAVYKVEGSFYKDYTKDKDKSLPDQLKIMEFDGSWLLRYRIGSGLVTVLSETSFFSNDSIDKLDHAFFLSHLVTDAEKIWLIYSSNVDSIFSILWKNMPLLLISLFFVLFFALWTQQMYSGPRKKLEDAHSHNILSHIEASGRYSWRTDRCRLTVEKNRKHLLRSWRMRKHGTSMETDTGDLMLSGVVDKTPMSEQDIDIAFRLKYDNELEFIRVSRALQKFGVEIQGGDKRHND